MKNRNANVKPHNNAFNLTFATIVLRTFAIFRSAADETAHRAWGYEFKAGLLVKPRKSASMTEK